MTVLAARHFGTNAKMMADVAKLYIDLANDHVLDPTYGEGGFWKKVRPTRLYAADLDETKSALGPVDFRELPWSDASFDVVVFDPTYVVKGGRETSTIPGMDKAYGMDTAEKTPEQQWERVIWPGFQECHRVLKPGGLLMFKGANYISSGRYHNWLHRVTEAVYRESMIVVDMMIFTRASGGPQPKGRREVHARNNWSFLLIARKARA